MTLTACRGYVYHEYAWTCSPMDGSEGLVIGDKLTFYYVVSNTGPSDTTATLRWTLPNPPNPWYATWEGEWAQHYSDIQPAPGGGLQRYVGAGQSFWLRIGGPAKAPGELLATAEATASMTFDPDETNNTVAWESEVACSITGTPGDDVLLGTDEVDSICGGDGDDHLTAVGDEDKLFGEDGNDLFDGTGGVYSGTAVGGAGFDTVSYANADRPITLCRETEGINRWVNVSAWAPNGLVDMERFIGSPFGDVMQGNSGPDILVGRGGRDTLIGLSGRDTLLGGRGEDKFITRDKVRDTIRGGHGRDRGRVDDRDVLISAQATSTVYRDPCD